MSKNPKNVNLREFHGKKHLASSITFLLSRQEATVRIYWGEQSKTCICFQKIGGGT